MRQPLKVMTLVGTRPELIRLSRIIAKLDENVHHTLVHTGQNYDYSLNQVFFDQLKIRKPDYFLEAAESSAARTIAKVIEKVDDVLAEVAPDALLVLGDTNSALGIISAKRRKIPIFHMEAGNRCFDLRVPEEVNRKIVDHTSDINLTYSEIARQYLINEGFPPDRIIRTGSPLQEVIKHYRSAIDASSILSELALAKEGYFVLSSHREENVDSEENLRQLVQTIETLLSTYPKLKVVFSVHPRTLKRLDAMPALQSDRLIMSKPFGFLDYVQLQLNAYCVLSDSGTITEESSILGFPALNIRDAHERPEGMEEGAVVLTGTRAAVVVPAVELARRQVSGDAGSRLRVVHDYDVDNVSEKVLRILVSYTPFVNRYVWRKML